MVRNSFHRFFSMFTRGFTRTSGEAPAFALWPWQPWQAAGLIRSCLKRNPPDRYGRRAKGVGRCGCWVNFTNKPTKYRMEKDGTGKGFNPGWNHGINQKLIMIHDISSWYSSIFHHDTLDIQWYISSYFIMIIFITSAHVVVLRCLNCLKNGMISIWFHHFSEIFLVDQHGSTTSGSPWIFFTKILHIFLPCLFVKSHELLGYLGRLYILVWFNMV